MYIINSERNKSFIDLLFNNINKNITYFNDQYFDLENIEVENF